VPYDAPVRTLATVAFVLFLALPSPLRADEPAARRAEAAADRAEDAARRTEAAAARTEAAVERLERALEAMEQAENPPRRTAPSRTR